MNLKTRVVLLVVVLLVAGIWGLAARAGAVLQANLDKLVSDQLLATVGYVAADIDGNLKLRFDALQEIASAIAPAMDAGPAEVQRALEQHRISKVLFPSGVFVADRRGIDIAEYPTVPGRIGASVGDRKYFHEVMAGGDAVIAPSERRFSEQPVISLSVPLREASGRVAGALVAGVFPSDPALFGALGQTRLGKTGYFFVISPKDNVIVAASDRRRMPQPVRGREVNPLPDRRLYAGFEGAGVVTNSQGVEVLTASRNMKTSGWTVVAGVATEEIFAPIATLQRQIYLAALLISFAAALLLRWLLVRQLAPLEHAAQAMRRISEGKEAFSPLAVAREDEIGALLTNFNRLMQERERLEQALRKSEERFRDLAALSSDWYWEQDAQLRFTQMSEELYPKSRLRPESTIGKLRWELPIVGVSEEQWRQHRTLLARRDAFADFVYQMRNEAGELRWFSINGRPVFGADGEFLGYRGTGRDLTEKMKTEAALREHEQHVGVLFDSLPLAIGHADCEQRISFVNRMFRAIFGSDPDPAGRLVREVIGEDRYAIVAPYLRRALAGEEVAFETAYVGRDAASGTRWVRYIPDRDAAGNVIGFFALIEDISERKRIEQALQDAYGRLAAEKELNQNIIDTAPIGICIYDEMGNCVSANPAMAQHIGATHAQVLAQNFHRIESWKRTGMYDLALRTLARDAPQSMSVHTASSFGKDVWLDIFFCPLHSGDRRQLMLLTNDVSERERAEAMRARFAAIVENSNDAIVSRALDGTIVSWNRAAERLLGYRAEEAIGQSIAIIMPPGQQGDWVPHSRLLLEGGQIPPTEVLRRARDGQLIDVLRSLSPIRNESGEVVGAAIIMHDITRRKQTEAALLRLNTELEQRVAQRTTELERINSELEAFTYSVSHDLRSPLRAINGFAAIVLDENQAKLGADSVDFLRRIVAAARRMGLLIDDLLALSRVSRQELQTREFDLSALAVEVAAALAQAQPRPDVQVSIQPGMRLDADPGLMRIALENLIGNAWKFSAHTRRAAIEIGNEARDGAAVYFVRDNGAGFDMQHAARLFKPFQRLHSEAEFEGTGIGLSIVQRVVSRHGGSVWAEGATGRGATFYFTLQPAAR